ncbi:hypothetical protein GPAL_1283 [Glaciecola pallidula DSM 14239 = ACAM 615]|uniref:Uncharacterized protein n=1 Tax=Brumicola pallidula DSM 14239 = ACAM 615 TaxID=1121922 RepID=K6YVW6_9ALTE|nr:hypothetical protein GPAL_1283 [Glaciecola pallidula DSM 14239 = ACAM 615]
MLNYPLGVAPVCLITINTANVPKKHCSRCSMLLGINE